MGRYIDTSKVTIPKGFFEDLNTPKLLEWLKSQPTADVALKKDIVIEILEEVERVAMSKIDKRLSIAILDDTYYIQAIDDLKKKYTGGAE